MPRKRAANGSGSIRLRKDGRWEARYTVGTSPATGKQIRKSIIGKTQEEVAKKLRKATSSVDDGLYMEPSRITVTQWMDIWQAEYLGAVKEHTVASYDVQSRVHIKPSLGAVKLRALTTPAIQSFYNQLLRGDGERKPLRPKTVKNVHGVLHKALDQAKAIGYIVTNPADAVKLPKVQKEEIHPLDEEQTVAFLAAIEGDPDRLMYHVALFTGMRQSEILGLTWDRISFEDEMIRIDRQLIKEKKKGGIYKFAPPKNDKPRTITPATHVMQLLKERRREQAEQRLKAGSMWVNDPSLKELVFTDELGKHLCHGTVLKHFKAAAGAIGAPDNARFHDLRHTYAVASIMAGDDIKTLSENLGHATVAFTLDVYAHVTPSMKKQSAARMDSYIQRIISHS